MKKIAIIILATLISCNVNNKSATKKSRNIVSLIGTWTYFDTKNKAGITVKTYNTEIGKANATGPKIIFNIDGTYVKIFTPKNSDKGKWTFNDKTMSIEYDLYIDSTDFIGKDLISKGLAVKQKDGNYYERVEDKVIKLDNEELITEERGVYFTFKKMKTAL